jgi:hypothetical protein
LGPDAPRRIAAALRRHGYRLRCARSDWRLGAADGLVLGALMSGIAAAAGEADAWLGRRQAQIAGRRLSVRVGHVDVLALPPAGRAKGGITLRHIAVMPKPARLAMKPYAIRAIVTKSAASRAASGPGRALDRGHRPYQIIAAT